MPILKFPGTVWYFSLWYKHCLKIFWVYCRIIFLKQVFDILRLNGKKKLSRGKISRGSIKCTKHKLEGQYYKVGDTNV